MTGINELEHRLNAIIRDTAYRVGFAKRPREMSEAELYEKIRELRIRGGHPETAAMTDEEILASIRRDRAAQR